MEKKLDILVKEMKDFGEFLIPFNFPRVTVEEEDDVNFIKAKEACVDGYTLILHYTKADYETHFLETLQVLGKYVPFLPFSLVCKIGKRFLGEQRLSLVEIFKDNRKIYCWTRVLDRDGNPIDGPYEQETVSNKIYDGLEYRSMDPRQVNFY